MRKKRLARHLGRVRSAHRKMTCISCFKPKAGMPKRGNTNLRTRAKYRRRKEDFEDV